MTTKGIGDRRESWQVETVGPLWCHLEAEEFMDSGPRTCFDEAEGFMQSAHGRV